MFEHTRIEAASIKIDYWMDSEALLYYIWEIFKPVWYQAQSLRFSAKTVFLPFIGENFMVELLGAHLQMKPVEISALPFLGENDHWTFIAVSFVSDHAEIGGQLHIKRVKIKNVINSVLKKRKCIEFSLYIHGLCKCCNRSSCPYTLIMTIK